MVADFGNPVTDGTQQAAGTYGYVVTFDLTANRLRRLKGLQLLNTTTDVFSEFIDTPDVLATLMEYPENASCPDIAFVQSGMIVNVFLKTSVYAFAATNRIAFWLWPQAQVALIADESVAMPADAVELVKAECLKMVAQSKGKPVALVMNSWIAREKKRLGL